MNINLSLIYKHLNDEGEEELASFVHLNIKGMARFPMITTLISNFFLKKEAKRGTDINFSLNVWEWTICINNK